MGIAPWYRFRSRSGARAIHFLGDGEVCSDYLSILCKPQNADGIASALADWLGEANGSAAGQPDGSNAGSEDRGWDRLEIFGVDAADHAVNQLVTQLQARGSVVSPCRPMNTWRLPLPASWEELLEGQSKQHRNRLRKADREYFQSGRITARRVEYAGGIRAVFRNPDRPPRPALEPQRLARSFCIAAISGFSSRDCRALVGRGFGHADLVGAG